MHPLGRPRVRFEICIGGRSVSSFRIDSHCTEANGAIGAIGVGGYTGSQEARIDVVALRLAAFPIP